MTIFFDLDGTLIDCKERLYRLFVDLTQSQKISFEEYWQLKRTMFDHDWILSKIFNYSDEQLAIFHESWMKLIESKEYLKFNKLFDYTIPLLENVRQYQLYIIAARQYEERILDEISTLGIQNYFQGILVSNQKRSKDEIIIERGINTQPEDLFIGDTGIDILAGKKLNIRTVGVLSGFRGYESLAKHHPDYIITNISEMNKIIV